MAMKEMVFVLTILVCIFAVLLTIAVIVIAIWFQRIRKKIEAEINAGMPKENERVAKMTVKPRKRQNKYSKNTKRSGDQEPEFYDSPPMRDEHREILKMKTLQKQYDVPSPQITQVPASHTGSYHAVTMPRLLKKEDSYIECIGDDEHMQRMTTFQGATTDSVTQAPQKYKPHATTMPRTLVKEDSYIECIGDDKTLQRTTTFQGAKREYVTEVQQNYKSNATTSMSRTLQRDEIDGNSNRKINPQARSLNPSREATLHIPPSLPIKKGHGHGIKGGFRDTVSQQQVSRNTNLASANDHVEEMYEIMEENSEIYENTGYVDDSPEDVYENQEIIEEGIKRRPHINMAQLPKHSRNWNSQAPNYHEDVYEEEVYENQEIVEQERRKRAQSEASGQVELYENYVEESMYENC